LTSWRWAHGARNM